MRTGVPWRDLPERYAPRTTVYNRYARWARRGLWRGIFEALARHKADSLLFTDASIVKAHRAATGEQGGLAQDTGRSRSGRAGKAHAIVNEKFQLAQVVVTGG